MEISQEPIIKYFKIIGLHGYKDVVIDFESSVRVIIAENGAGKTTILSALYSFLTCQFHNLKSIDFQEIHCVFYNSREEIKLVKTGLSGMSSHEPEALEEILKYTTMDEAACISSLTSGIDLDDISEVRTSDLGMDLMRSSPWNWGDIQEVMSTAAEYVGFSMDEETKSIIKKIKAAVGDTEILYLPTYRRIEKSFGRGRGGDRTTLNRYQRRHKRRKSSMSSQMNYGLADVEERLANLTEEVQRRTNFGYREISANIIDDLLSGKAKQTSPDFSKLPDLETLKLFFSRIGGKEIQGEHLERVQKIYDNKEQEIDADRSTLLYFLSKLSLVVNQTRQLESTIENFVKKANTYLGATSDEKVLNYDPEKMKVTVINKWTSDEVELNDLSSGEKQVLSLLSYLFLYPSEKIILIDEPELSLSLDWQERILLDIVTAPSCKQLLAITHSPFIFDNELDSYSSSLDITRIKKQPKDKHV